MKTFQATDNYNKIKYDFKFSEGKLVKIAVSKLHSKAPAVEAYANPAKGQNAISKALFSKAMSVVCTDPVFVDYKGFLEQLNKDSMFKEDAKTIIAGYIRSMAIKINRMALALEEA